MTDVVVTAAINRLCQAIDRFDESTGELVKTTNKLTTYILVLTIIFLIVGTVQTVFTVLAYFKR